MKRNWPSSRPAVQPSSRPETGRPDDSLYPSRLSRTQINPKIPNELHRELMDFLGVNRQYSLQDLISRGIRLALDEIAAARGRPAVQPSSRPVIDQIDDQIDFKNDGSINIDQKISRPAVQPSELTRELREEVARILPAQAVETWFAPLTVFAEHDERTLVFNVPNTIARDWIVSNYTQEIAVAMTGNENLAAFAGWPITWRVGKTPEPPIDDDDEESATVPEKPRTAGECKEELLEFYALVMENTLAPRDEAAFDLVAHCSPEAVRAGIMRSKLKAREPVGSFAYCVKAIRQIQQAGLGIEFERVFRNELFSQPLLPEVGAAVVQLNQQRKDRK